MTFDRNDLLGAWAHSHEEDTEQASVYRRASYAFPPSRGRLQFQLLENGQAIFGAWGANDVPGSEQATWSLSPDGKLRIEGQGRVLLTATIDSSSKGKLSLRIE